MTRPHPPWPPRRYLRRFAAALVLLLAGCGLVAVVEQAPPPPATAAGDVVDVLHGVAVPDPYRWLEDQESAETRAWIAAQNAYTDAVLDGVGDQAGLHARFTELMEIDSVEVPVAAGGRYFFKRRRAEQELAVIYLRQGADGEDQVLIDPHPLSADLTTSVALRDVTPDGRLLAYAVRAGGEDEVTIRLYDVDARADLDDVLPRARYSGVSLTPDRTGLYYTRHSEDGPRLFHHPIGADTADDTMIFGDGLDPGLILFASLSDDGRHLLAHVLHGSSGTRVDLYYQPLGGAGAIARADGFVAVAEGVEATFFGQMAGDRLLIQTTWQAPNGRVMLAHPSDPAMARWRELVAERERAVVRSTSAVGGEVFVSYLEDVVSRVERFDLEGRPLGEIAFDTLGTVSNVGGRFGDPEAFFVFASFHVPTTVYRYQVTTGERSVWARSEAPVKSDAFTVEQVWVPSRDGTRVPMFLMHKKGLTRDGARPTLLTGYGGFNASVTPSFRASAVTWAERGGVYAVANLRGGGEFGEAWHRAGMLGNKQNVFDDFIAAAEWLIESGYSSPAKLAIQGGSNGGLLVGAAMNQRPDLFAAVVCAYPLLDMVRYHRFLVARYWVPEYGSAEDPEHFAFLHAYSPYHNVVAGTAYPAVLYITGDGDTRVAPLHARKMAASMQAAGSPNPVLLRYHTKAGHSGGAPRSEQIDNAAESFAFLLWQLGETS